ncbi:Com family DNA-binding transcriptional regulator [Oryzisolibacter propanilivorax]|uniref:Com family DNA-binding transcriptional regulator n=1 Tax=Oryzisolibacter propanilivorax TaxID=1527607 RepID=UPI000B82F78E|nr:Com family DNA-binding transcriptional regulator [Oryzisolibacter propanilivorax]
MEEIRCGNCRRKLGEGVYLALSIKCPRCGALNQLRAQGPSPARRRASEPQGTLSGKPHNQESAGATPAR